MRGLAFICLFVCEREVGGVAICRSGVDGMFSHYSMITVCGRDSVCAGAAGRYQSIAVVCSGELLLYNLATAGGWMMGVPIRSDNSFLPPKRFAVWGAKVLLEPGMVHGAYTVSAGTNPLPFF